MKRTAKLASSPSGEGRPEHVLLVAGPGGSGKSTFLRLLAAAELPSDIRRELPGDVEKWPQLMPRVLRAQSSRKPFPSRFVLHYDTAGYAIRAGIPFAGDPALLAVWSAARATVVDIRPSVAQLISQASSRMDEEDRRRGRVSRFWRWSGLRALVKSREGSAPGEPVSKADLYREPGWLAACYARWDLFLSETLPGQGDVVLIRVEPMTAECGCPSFRLITLRSGRDACP